jgi:hypothetical protein
MEVEWHGMEVEWNGVRWKRLSVNYLGWARSSLLLSVAVS